MNRKHQILGSVTLSGRSHLQSLLKTSVKVATLASVALTVSGCGQKGPLYLPAPAASTAPTSSNTPSK
jgi:predicted small lipoprotein YifL